MSSPSVSPSLGQKTYQPMCKRDDCSREKSSLLKTQRAAASEKAPKPPIKAHNKGPKTPGASVKGITSKNFSSLNLPKPVLPPPEFFSSETVVLENSTARKDRKPHGGDRSVGDKVFPVSMYVTCHAGGDEDFEYSDGLVSSQSEEGAEFEYEESDPSSMFLTLPSRVVVKTRMKGVTAVPDGRGSVS